MRYGSKADLLADIERAHETLLTLLRGIPESRYGELGVWGDDWSVHDLVAHLAEWHAFFLRWHEVGAAGGRPPMPAPGYKWNETPRLNRAIQAKHRLRPLTEVRADFAATYARILGLARELSEDELLRPGYFPWTGRNALVTYLGANTASHYRFAIRVLRRWLKGTTGGRDGSPG
jgi:hypothetical protein